jgi:hypothetical protein
LRVFIFIYRTLFPDFHLNTNKMSHLCRLIPRATTNILYVSRMNAHNLPAGSSVKVPEAKSGHHVVSGSGQFIATDGPSAKTRSGIGGGSSASMLPGAQTADDKTNPTKTTGDTKQSHSKGGSDKAYEKNNKNSIEFLFLFCLYRHQSIFTSPAGIAGLAVVGVVSLCKYKKRIKF